MAGAKDALLGFDSISDYLFHWILNDNLFPVDLGRKDEPLMEEKPDNLSDTLFYSQIYSHNRDFYASIFPEFLSDSEVKPAAAEGKTYYLVSAMVETKDHKFIRFLLEKQNGSWKLVNKSDCEPYKNWTFQEFKNAEFKAPVSSSHVYVNQEKLDEFFSFKYSKLDFVPDDENVNAFLIDLNRKEEDSNADENINFNEPTKNNNGNSVVTSIKSDNSRNFIHIPYLVIFALIITRLW